MSTTKKEESTALDITQTTGTTPADLLRVAVDQNADLDKLEKLLDLQMRWEADRARKAYFTALAAFKSECPPVLNRDKNVEIKTQKGPVTYTHATLGAIAEVVTPYLCRHGLSYSWSTEQPDRLVRVTCTVKHEQGHSESVELAGPPDTSGLKNSIQQIGSAITYLERYTLLAALGLATADQDDDGQTAGQHFEPVRNDAASRPEETGAPLDDHAYTRLLEALHAARSEEALRRLAVNCGSYSGEQREELLATWKARRQELRREVT